MVVINVSINARIVALSVVRVSVIDVNLDGFWLLKHLDVNLYVEMEFKFKLKYVTI